MNESIIIQTTGFEITPAIETRIEKSLAKLFKIDQSIVKVEVYLDSQKKTNSTSNQVKVIVSRPGKDITVKNSSDNLYKCIAQTGDEVARAVRKEKEKAQDRARQADDFFDQEE